MNILDIVGATVTPIEDKEMLITIHPRFFGDTSTILYFPVYLDYWNLGIHVGDIPKDEKTIVYKEFEHAKLYIFQPGVCYLIGHLRCDGYYNKVYWSPPLCESALPYSY